MLNAVPLKRLARLIAGATPPVADESYWADGGTPWVTIADMTAQSRIATTTRQLSSLGVAHQGMAMGRPGTLLFAMYASVGALAELDTDASWNQAIVGVVPAPTTDSRFLHYALQALRPQLQRWYRSNTQDNLNAEQVGALPIPDVGLDEQRKVADYLDRETARIDALIAAKHRMVDLLGEKAAVTFVQALAGCGFKFPAFLDLDRRITDLPVGWRLLRLSQVLRQLTNGYVGPTRDILRDEGIRYIQSVHIKGGTIDFERRPFYVDEQWHRERPRIHLRAGDVLIVQTGAIGQVAVVPKGFGAASCHALQIARARPEVCSGEYLGAYLRSPYGYQSLLSRATGALHPHLEGGIRDVPVVVPPLSVQQQLIRDVRSSHVAIDKLIRRVKRQLQLVEERRQALITAGVLGELPASPVAL